MIVGRIARFGSLVMVLVSALMLSGCEYFSSPQNTFNPGGTVAEQQKDDFLLVMWPSLVIGVIVMVGVVFIAIRFRRKPGDPGLPKQIHGNTALELSWTILPILLLAVIAVPTVEGIRTLADTPDDAMHVKVTGVQWAWLFEYPDIDAGGAPLAPPVGELRIPVGKNVAFEIHSSDVNHSFWVPKLAGKTDAINNHVNHMWFRADEPGEYSGQCAEFCGLNHYNMRMTIIAMPQEEFDAWVAEQQNAARQETGDGDTQLASTGE